MLLVEVVSKRVWDTIALRSPLGGSLVILTRRSAEESQSIFTCRSGVERHAPLPPHAGSALGAETGRASATGTRVALWVTAAAPGGCEGSASGCAGGAATSAATAPAPSGAGAAATGAGTGATPAVAGAGTAEAAAVAGGGTGGEVAASPSAARALVGASAASAAAAAVPGGGEASAADCAGPRSQGTQMSLAPGPVSTCEGGASVGRGAR